LQFLLTSLCVITLVLQPVLYKQYNIKCSKGQITFSAIIAFFALIFFAVTTKNISITTKIIPYSLAFAICYGAATLTNILAVKIGSLAITSLVISYSLVIPTVYGLLFLNEKAGPLQYIGILSLLISLFLVRDKAEEDSDKKKVTLLWIVYLVIGFFTNGFCSIIQNEQRRKFDGTENGNFMILSLAICVVMLLIFALIIERKEVLVSLKNGLIIGGANGICNGATNLLVMLSVAIVPASVFFPVLSAGQIVFTYIISVLIFKEKFIKRQNIGIIFGILALVLLNI